MLDSRKNRVQHPCFLFAVLSVFFMAFATGLWGQQLESDNPRALAAFREGMRLAEQDDIQGALEKFRQAIAIDPNFIQAHLRYMDCFRSVGRGDEVVQMYRNKVRENPNNPLYLFLYGRTLDDLAAKRAQFKAALEADSTFYWAQLSIGGTYLMENRYDEAIVALNKALELNPKLVEARQLLGTIYLEKGMPYQARRHFEAAIALDSTDAGLYLRLGQVYSQLERYESAEKAFRRSAALAPDEPLIYYYLGVVCELGNHPQRAIEAYQQFLNKAPEHEMAAKIKKNIEKLKKQKPSR